MRYGMQTKRRNNNNKKQNCQASLISYFYIVYEGAAQKASEKKLDALIHGPRWQRCSPYHWSRFSPTNLPAIATAPSTPIQIRASPLKMHLISLFNISFSPFVFVHIFPHFSSPLLLLVIASIFVFIRRFLLRSSHCFFHFIIIFVCRAKGGLLRLVPNHRPIAPSFVCSCEKCQFIKTIQKWSLNLWSARCCI